MRFSRAGDHPRQTFFCCQQRPPCHVVFQDLLEKGIPLYFWKLLLRQQVNSVHCTLCAARARELVVFGIVCESRPQSCRASKWLTTHQRSGKRSNAGTIVSDAPPPQVLQSCLTCPVTEVSLCVCRYRTSSSSHAWIRSSSTRFRSSEVCGSSRTDFVALLRSWQCFPSNGRLPVKVCSLPFETDGAFKRVNVRYHLYARALGMVGSGARPVALGQI